jgi:hypothetical protein
MFQSHKKNEENWRKVTAKVKSETNPWSFVVLSTLSSWITANLWSFVSLTSRERERERDC